MLSLFLRISTTQAHRFPVRSAYFLAFILPFPLLAYAQESPIQPKSSLQSLIAPLPASTYICPPCGANCHGPEHAWSSPGSCPVCGMDLVLRPHSLSLTSLALYEGTYEYVDGLTIQIAASPADTMLYALLDGNQYLLASTSQRDVFMNTSQQHVVFIRNDSGHVSGYTLPDENAGIVYDRLSAGADLPADMWYPRLEAQEKPYTYTYTPPQTLEDGLTIGSLYNSSLDSARIHEMIEHISEGVYPGVHSVLILEDDSLVLEEYFYGYDRDAQHQMRSATKSFISTLIGIAIDQGLLQNTAAPILPYFAEEYHTLENLSDAKQSITVRDLLTQRSGLACDDWNPESPGNESLMGQSADWIKFTLDLPMVHTPGTVTSYCSGGVVVLGRLIEKLAGVPLETFARMHLFEPLGIEDYDWRFEPDRSSAQTFTQLYLRPRDMVKFGLLYSKKGRWKGHQVISEQWTQTSLASHTLVGDTDYGYLWWRPYLNVPGGRHHGIAAQGNGGQEIYLWPALDMIVVLTGGTYNQRSHTNTLLINYILPPLH